MLFGAFAQAREQFVDVVQPSAEHRPAGARAAQALEAEAQVLGDGKRSEQLPAFGHLDDAQLDHLRGAQARLLMSLGEDLDDHFLKGFSMRRLRL